MNLLSLVGPRLDNICQIRRKWYYLSSSKNLQSEQGLISPSIFSNLYGELIQRNPERRHDQKLSRADAPASAINCLLRWCSQGRQRTTWLLVAIDVTFGTVFGIVPLNLNEWLLLDLPVCSLTSFSSLWAGVHGQALYVLIVWLIRRIFLVNEQYFSLTIN